MQDLIIIGGGPAGMTAAVYAVRKQLDTLVIAKDLGGQLLWTKDIENYMGYQYITGPELINKFEEQVKRFPVTIKYDEVIKLSRAMDGSFAIKTSEDSYHCKAVIVASGKRPRRLNVPGEEEFTGRGVGYCATCDGPLYAGKAVAVVGGGNSALQAAVELCAIATRVYLVARGSFRADPVVVDKLRSCNNLEVLTGYRVKEIQGGQSVEKIAVSNGEQSRDIAVEGLFVEIGLDPNSEFARDTVKFNTRNEIVVDCRASTGIPGLFAAGDVTSGPEKQIIIAAGDGAKAALGVYEYLLYKR